MAKPKVSIIVPVYNTEKYLKRCLDSIVEQRGTNFSGGQKQRLAIARAVLSGAPIMLLDEATGSLDEKTEKQVIENLLSLKDTTVILVSHRISAAGMCDRIIKVENKKFFTQD